MAKIERERFFKGTSGQDGDAFSENMDFKLKAVHQEYHSAIGTAVIHKMEMFKLTSGQFSQGNLIK